MPVAGHPTDLSSERFIIADNALTASSILQLDEFLLLLHLSFTLHSQWDPIHSESILLWIFPSLTLLSCIKPVREKKNHYIGLMAVQQTTGKPQLWQSGQPSGAPRINVRAWFLHCLHLLTKNKRMGKIVQWFSLLVHAAGNRQMTVNETNT